MLKLSSGKSVDNGPTSIVQQHLPVPMPKDPMMLMRACRHDEDQEQLTPCHLSPMDLTPKMF
jgi:hypothetical protein